MTQRNTGLPFEDPVAILVKREAWASTISLHEALNVDRNQRHTYHLTFEPETQTSLSTYVSDVCVYTHVFQFMRLQVCTHRLI